MVCIDREWTTAYICWLAPGLVHHPTLCHNEISVIQTPAEHHADPCTGDTVLTRPKEQEAASLWEALRSRMLQGVEIDPVRILGPVTLMGAPVVWKRA